LPKPHPECPVFVPVNCPDYRNPKICALVRGDRCCLHRPGRGQRERIFVAMGPIRPDYEPTVLRNPETRLEKGEGHMHYQYDRGWRELE